MKASNGMKCAWKGVKIANVVGEGGREPFLGETWKWRGDSRSQEQHFREEQDADLLTRRTSLVGGPCEWNRVRGCREYEGPRQRASSVTNRMWAARGHAHTHMLKADLGYAVGGGYLGKESTGARTGPAPCSCEGGCGAWTEGSGPVGYALQMESTGLTDKRDLVCKRRENAKTVEISLATPKNSRTFYQSVRISFLLMEKERKTKQQNHKAKQTTISTLCYSVPSNTLRIPHLFFK